MNWPPNRIWRISKTLGVSCPPQCLRYQQNNTLSKISLSIKSQKISRYYFLSISHTPNIYIYIYIYIYKEKHWQLVCVCIRKFCSGTASSLFAKLKMRGGLCECINEGNWLSFIIPSHSWSQSLAKKNKHCIGPKCVISLWENVQYIRLPM